MKHLIRRWAIKRALRERLYELARKGQCTYHAYILCKFSGFKPGAQERMENEMRILAERIVRARRYVDGR